MAKKLSTPRQWEIVRSKFNPKKTYEQIAKEAQAVGVSFTSERIRFYLIEKRLITDELREGVMQDVNNKMMLHQIRQNHNIYGGAVKWIVGDMKRIATKKTLKRDVEPAIFDKPWKGEKKNFTQAQEQKAFKKFEAILLEKKLAKERKLKESERNRKK